jgi:hypothetical protein
MRDKWDRPDYQRRTINEALETVSECYRGGKDDTLLRLEDQLDSCRQLALKKTKETE